MRRPFAESLLLVASLDSRKFEVDTKRINRDKPSGEMGDASAQHRDHAGAQRRYLGSSTPGRRVSTPSPYNGRHRRYTVPEKSPLRAVVDLRAMDNIEDVDNMVFLVDPVDNAISAAQGAVTASERPKSGLPTR